MAQQRKKDLALVFRQVFLKKVSSTSTTSSFMFPPLFAR
jgi:hypothetical protein